MYKWRCDGKSYSSSALGINLKLFSQLLHPPFQELIFVIEIFSLGGMDDTMSHFSRVVDWELFHPSSLSWIRWRVNTWSRNWLVIRLQKIFPITIPVSIFDSSAPNLKFKLDTGSMPDSAKRAFAFTNMIDYHHMFAIGNIAINLGHHLEQEIDRNVDTAYSHLYLIR